MLYIVPNGYIAADALRIHNIVVLRTFLPFGMVLARVRFASDEWFNIMFPVLHDNTT